MKWNGCVALLNIPHTNLQHFHNIHQWLTPFSPFDIKCKKCEKWKMWKISEIVFLEFWSIMLQYLVQPLCNI